MAPLICKLGIGDNPSIAGSYVDLSSNYTGPAQALFHDNGGVVWTPGTLQPNFVVDGKRHGEKLNYELLLNGKIELIFDLYATDIASADATLSQINEFIRDAKEYDKSNGTSGKPVVLTLQLPGGIMEFLDVRWGTPVSSQITSLSDATRLGGLIENVKLELTCRPEKRKGRISLDNRQINGDFQNSINLSGSGIDGWTQSGGYTFYSASNVGYYGSNAMIFTGSNVAGFGNVVGDFIPVNATNIPVSTPICVSFWIKLNQGTNTFSTDVKLQYYNGGTFVSDNIVKTFSAGQVPSAWTQYFLALTIPASGVTQIRIVGDANNQEAVGNQWLYDGFAIWMNATTPPIEYVAIPGNLVNPARAYGIQGDSPPLFKMSITPHTAAYAAQPVLSTVDIGINPRAADGVYGATYNRTTTYEKPLAMCYPMTITHPNPGSDSMASGTTDSNDLRSRAYMVKVRSTGTMSSLSGVTCSVVSSGSGYFGGTPLTLEVQDLTLDGSITAVLNSFVELGRFFMVSPLSALFSSEDSATRPVITNSQIQIYYPAPSQTTLYAWFLRSDWSYAYIAITSAYNSSTTGATVLDSESGVLSIYRESIATDGSRFPAKLKTTTGASAMKLKSGKGSCNEIQIAYVSSANTPDIAITDFYSVKLEYSARYLGSAA